MTETEPEGNDDEEVAFPSFSFLKSAATYEQCIALHFEVPSITFSRNQIICLVEAHQGSDLLICNDPFSFCKSIETQLLVKSRIEHEARILQ